MLTNKSVKIMANQRASLLANQSTKTLANQIMNMLANQSAKMLTNKSTKTLANYIMCEDASQLEYKYASQQRVNTPANGLAAWFIQPLGMRHNNFGCTFESESRFLENICQILITLEY